MSEPPAPEPAAAGTEAPTPPRSVLRRGGDQIIPRPSTWTPGAPAPWAALPADLRRPALADLRAALVGAPPPRRSPLEIGEVRGAAVLAPLYEEAGELHVVLTRRPWHMRSHRGEVSFPGGAQDPGEDLRSTALREAWEETQLDPATVEIVGELHHLQTVTSQSFIVPFVGVLPGRPELVANPTEVERILHVPLSELMADDVYHEEHWGLPPLDRAISFFEIEGDTIWGATGWMLRELLGLVAEHLRATR